MDGDFREYRFEAVEVDFTVRVKISSAVSAVWRRKDMLKGFCYDNGVEYPPKTGKKYHLTKDGYVVHNLAYVEYLGGLGDKVIMAKYPIFMRKKNQVEVAIEKITAEIADEEKYIKKLRGRLLNMQSQLKVVRNPLQIITLQNNIGNRDALIRNQSEELRNKKATLEALRKIAKGNVVGWKKQVGLIETMLVAAINRYVGSVTKGIRDTFNFTDFSFIMPEHSEDAEKAINGEEIK
jgi:hypothetical protein